MTKLSFYDHSRQSYAGQVPLRDGVDGEFMIGDYTIRNTGGVGRLGEFAIRLHDFSGLTHSHKERSYSPQLCVFTDATGALKKFLDTGAWDAIKRATDCNAIRTTDDLTVILVKHGLRDVSDVKMVKS